MCGRYTRTLKVAELEQTFRRRFPALAASYNVAPSQPVVAFDGREEGFVATWGFRPGWSDRAVINARDDKLATSRFWKAADGRVAIPATGFYEWQKTEGGKRPHHIAFADTTPFAFAGLRVDNADGPTVAIVTTSPNDLMRPIHDRMPVMLRGQAIDRWLADGRFDSIGSDDLVAVEVSTTVNSPKNDRPECLTPVARAH
ncbi:MAG: SOS response-associated peptidase [Planctomycetota bacterium]